MKRRFLLLSSSMLLLLSVGACAAKVEKVLEAPPPEGPPPQGAADSSSNTTAPPASSVAQSNDCMDHADCNDDPSVDALFGQCWRPVGSPVTSPGSCLCRVGRWLQPSGKCGATAPAESCAALGATCTSWPTCSTGGGHRQGGTVAAGSCATSGATEPPVCCVASSACRSTKITSCYRRGTDAAYTPVCFGGWLTCEPGDSPDLSIGG
jgi:hypothetical protein